MQTALARVVRRVVPGLIVVFFARTVAAQQGSAPPVPGATRPLSTTDIQGWESIRSSSLSNDGRWLAYQLVPNDGDAEVVLRATREGKEHRFQIGEVPAPAGGAQGAAAAAGSPVLIGATSRFAAFTIYPTAKEAKHAHSPNE